MDDLISDKIDPIIFKKEIRNIKIQRLLGYITFLFLGNLLFLVLKFIKGYKIKDLKKIRKKYQEITRNSRKILICPNHLTMIDSIILHWAFGSISWYFFHFRNFMWNVPAVENFKSKLGFRILTYLGKCIPIDRKGSPEHIDLVLEEIRFLLRQEENFLVFPEGGRSRTGRIELENTTYGIGKIIQGVEDLEVLCVYMRGQGQDTYSHYPKTGEIFKVEMELFKPQTTQKGLRGMRDYAIQVMTKLRDMEDQYFETREENG
jgi:1-acyl-sn-glycerol-3-phosphate acyltransferase